IKLSLKRAIEIGTAAEGNTNIQLADQSVQIAQAHAAEVRAALLPDISGSVGAQNDTRNLASLGLASTPLTGLGQPRLVGPYNLVDARLSGSQTLLDLGALRRYQSSKLTVGSEKQGRGAAVDQAAGKIARAYVAALEADAGYDVVQADVALAEA